MIRWVQSMRHALRISTIAAIVTSVGVGSNLLAEEPGRDLDAKHAKLVKEATIAEQKLATHLFRFCSQESKGGNSTISPYGVYELLALLETGTAGKSAEVIKQTLGFGPEAHHDSIAGVVADLRDLGSKVRFELGSVLTDNSPYGLKIADVEPEGPADLAGLRTDDLLFTVDGAPVGQVEDFQALLDDSFGEVELSGFSRRTSREFSKKLVTLRQSHLEEAPLSERPLALASVVCLDPAIMERSPFPGRVSRYYPAECFPTDFSAPQDMLRAARSYLSNTLGKEVGERFTLPEQLDGDARLWAANTVLMNAAWLEPLRRDSDGAMSSFRTPTELLSLPMLRGHLTLSHYADFSEQGFRILELGYEQSTLVFQIILPTSPTGWKTLPAEAWLSPEAYDAYRQVRQSRPIELVVPPFKLRQAVSLAPALSETRLAVLFSERANFSEISPEPLRLGAVRQQVFLEIDELGTRAGAFTEAELVTASAQPELTPFHVNHPFFFAVRDGTTGVVFFAGRVTDPRAP